MHQALTAARSGVAGLLFGTGIISHDRARIFIGENAQRSAVRAMVKALKDLVESAFNPLKDCAASCEPCTAVRRRLLLAGRGKHVDRATADLKARQLSLVQVFRCGVGEARCYGQALIETDRALRYPFSRRPFSSPSTSSTCCVARATCFACAIPSRRHNAGRSGRTTVRGSCVTDASPSFGSSAAP